MKMKKFINAPETITDEELVGLGLAYPDIVEVDGHLVISKDLASADRCDHRHLRRLRPRARPGGLCGQGHAGRAGGGRHLRRPQRPARCSTP